MQNIRRSIKNLGLASLLGASFLTGCNKDNWIMFPPAGYEHQIPHSTDGAAPLGLGLAGLGAAKNDPSASAVGRGMVDLAAARESKSSTTINNNVGYSPSEPTQANSPARVDYFFFTKNADLNGNGSIEENESEYAINNLKIESAPAGELVSMFYTIKVDHPTVVRLDVIIDGNRSNLDTHNVKGPWFALGSTSLRFLMPNPKHDGSTIKVPLEIYAEDSLVRREELTFVDR